MFSGEYYNFASVNKLKVFKNNYSYSIESKIYFVNKDFVTVQNILCYYNQEVTKAEIFYFITTKHLYFLPGSSNAFISISNFPIYPL